LPFEVGVEVLAAGGAAGAAGSSGTHARPSAGSAPESAAVPLAETSASESSAAASPNFATQPPGSGSTPVAAQSPLAGVLDRGGFVAFLTLFLIGLALNLTPCVYPMLGVTVSIFGARRAAPPLQVFGSAALYVLGMAVMYSSLGLAAAFTGGLFGGWLSNPIVSVGIGVLLIALSLSMFGLYELNPPAALLQRLGGTGTASALGIFASGLVVGVFAAPCIGPPVVALLAVVGQRGDPWFGFSSFFTLAMGLGAPYLVLGTFSNLLQRMPRSGEWMIWVKQAFGVVLLAVGLNYALLALLPRVGAWVVPAALVIGGAWLGFLVRGAASKPAFRAFQRLAGAAAILGGIALVAGALKHGLEFQPLASAETALAASDRPAAIDFSADWCQPCHELERVTFTDPRVIAAMKEFRLYKVDLTRYDSPEADRWRRQFGILGVPTVVFTRLDGSEVRSARVEGFTPPPAFLERVALAREAIAGRPADPR
jgi:thiol:disulfide interchange protein DsbD